jgi:hypothetical protein
MYVHLNLYCVSNTYHLHPQSNPCVWPNFWILLRLISSCSLVSVEEAASSLAGEDGSGVNPEAPSLLSFLLDRPRQATLASKLQTASQQPTKNTHHLSTISCYFKYRMHIFHISCSKIEVHLRFKELIASLQTVHGVARKELSLIIWSHQATSSLLPPLAVNQLSTFSSVIVWCYFSGVLNFLSVSAHLQMMPRSKEKYICIFER